MNRLVWLCPVLLALCGCQAEEVSLNPCEQATDYVSQCTGQQLASPGQCGPAEEAEAQAYLAMPCEDIQPGGKADAFIRNCGWMGKLLGWCKDYVCEDFASAKDADELVREIAALESQELVNLFYCNLPGMGGQVSPLDYLDLMMTEPTSFDWSNYGSEGTLEVTSQYWDVLWAYGFDVHALYEDLRSLVPADLQDLFTEIFEPLAFIKKEFTAMGDGVLLGQTSFGYAPDRAHTNPTVNVIWPARLTDADADRTEILMMTYSQHPWYLDGLDAGFIDYFRFLTPDLVIAKGNYGPYDPDDPAIQPELFLSPRALQFWMVRKDEVREIDLDRETTYISVPMIRALWNDALNTVPAEDFLTGTWEADLIMNTEILRGEAILTVSPGLSGTFRTSLGGDPETLDFASMHPATDGRTLEVPLGSEPALELRQIAAGVEVMAGKRCLLVDSEEEAKQLGKYTDFLSGTIREHFISQYLEEREGGAAYCLSYLLRKL